MTGMLPRIDEIHGSQYEECLRIELRLCLTSFDNENRLSASHFHPAVTAYTSPAAH